MLLGTVLGTLGDSWSRVLNGSPEEMWRSMARGGIHQEPGEWDEVKEAKWRMWIRGVVKRGVLGGKGGARALTAEEKGADEGLSLIELVNEMETRQKAWHTLRVHCKGPDGNGIHCENHVHFGDGPEHVAKVQQDIDGGSFLCLKIVGSVREIIKTLKLDEEGH